jgi:hypothetical protein
MSQEEAAKIAEALRALGGGETEEVRSWVHACMRACVGACVRACVGACVRGCMRAWVRACVVACVRELERVHGESVFEFVFAKECECARTACVCEGV